MKTRLAILLFFFTQFILSQEIITVKNGDFEFYLTKVKHKSGAQIAQIDIIKNGLQIQSIIPDSNSFFSFIRDEAIITIEDMNFDNHNDFRLTKSSMMEENAGFPFIYWIYNPSKELFEKKSDYEKITSPEFDYDKEEIISTWYGYLDDKSCYKYKIRNGVPILTEKYIELYIKKGEKISEYWKLINNELKLIEKKTL